MGSLARRTFCGCVVSQQASPFTEVIALREPQPENRVEEGGGDMRLQPDPCPPLLSASGHPKDSGLLAKLRGMSPEEGLDAGFALKSN